MVKQRGEGVNMKERVSRSEKGLCGRDREANNRNPVACSEQMNELQS